MSVALTSVLLGLVGMFGWGVYDFLGGVLAKRVGSFGTLLWSQVAGAALIVVVTLTARAWSGLSAYAALLALGSAALYCLGYLFFFRGFEKGNVSVVAATMNLWAVVTMAVAFGVMGQRLTGTQTIGAFTIIAGAVLTCIDWSALRGGDVRVSAGTPETLAGALFFGLYWNVSEVLAEDVGWLLATALIKVGVVGALFLAVILASRATTAVPGSTRRIVWTLVAMGLIEVCAVAAVNYGLVIGDAILVTPVASALSVVTILLAVLTLGERLSRLQSLGVVMAVGGVITTAL